MRWADRLLTVAVTATLTSAAWIVAGSRYDASHAPADVAGGAAAEEGSVAVAPPPMAPMRESADLLAIPVIGVTGDQLIDNYAEERGGEGDRLHEAIDIMAAAGTSVVAAAPGIVERLYRSEAGGNTIYLRSEDGRTIHYYAHLGGYAPGLHEGQRVRRGQRIGTVGSTGNADAGAPHLHFAILRTSPEAEWWEPAGAINPYPALMRNR